MPSHQDDQTPPEPGAERTGDRIAKLLARAGIASRREIERMIEEGRIAKDGVVLDTPATVLKSLAGVTVDGEPVGAPDHARLFIYHKPPGLLVTERDPKGRLTIYDRLPADLPRVVPVGRLDLATEGLLLLTTDGGFKRELELPATGVERSYRARAYGNITQAQLEDLADGVEIEGIRYGSIDANIERRTGANVWIELTLTEGKNREVRRVLEYLGLQVSRLIRTRYGPFILADMPPGEVGEIKQHDLVAFRKTLASPKRQREPMEHVKVEVPTRTRASGTPSPVQAGDQGRRPAPSHRGGPRDEGDVPYRGERVPRPVSARGSRGAARHPVEERPIVRDARSFRGGDDRPGRSDAPRGARAPGRPFGEGRGEAPRRATGSPDRASGDRTPFGSSPGTDRRMERSGFQAADERPSRGNAGDARPARADDARSSQAGARPSRSSTDPRPSRTATDPRTPRAPTPDRTGWAKAAPRPTKGRPDRSSPNRARPEREVRDGDDRPARAGTLSPRAKGPAGGRGRPPREGDKPRPNAGPSKGPSGGRGHPPRGKR